MAPVGDGGLAFYVEREDSDSYYRNVHPEHLNLQATYVGNFGNGWSGEVHSRSIWMRGTVIRRRAFVCMTPPVAAEPIWLF